MKMLRDYFIWALIICLFSGALFVLAVYLDGQDKSATPVTAEEIAAIKTWKLPVYMRENLQRELDDFNKRFEEKVQAYKKELKTRFTEFKDMPDDAILYLEGGIFIGRSDYLKLLKQIRDIQELRDKEKLKKEVKGDDKTTN